MIRFWKKDIINKLILVTSLLLVAGILAIGYLAFNMPAGKSVQGGIAEYFPQYSTPTQNLEDVPTLVSSDIMPSATATFPPVQNQPTAQHVLPSFTVKPAIEIEEPPPSTATQAPPLPAEQDCIPAYPQQTGKVLEIIDGNTSRVLIDGLVYVVRYIGLGVPSPTLQAEAAARANADLVYAKEVTLIADEADKDSSGRLLRYILVGDTFVNLELIQKGMAPVVESAGAASCDQTFKNAEQSAASSSGGRESVVSPTAEP